MPKQPLTKLPLQQVSKEQPKPSVQAATTKQQDDDEEEYYDEEDDNQ